MPEFETAFTIGSDLSEVDSLHEKLSHFGRQAGLPDRCMFEVGIAAEELCTNTILYGFDDKRDHWIEISLSLDEGILRMRIEDDGMPFNPLGIGDPDLTSPPDERPVGGLGVYMARKMMSQIAYERRGGKNVTTLVKRL